VAVPGDDEMSDQLRRRVLWSMPTGLYVLGSRSARGHDGEEAPRWNLMTASLAMQVATSPKLVGVAVDAAAVTAGLVREGRCFSLSFLSRDDRAVVRRFVKPVPPAQIVAESTTVISMAGEEVALHVTGAPVLARAVAWLDCELRQVVALGSHDLCIGEVVAAGGPSTGTGPVPVLGMQDTRMSYGG